MEYSCLKTLAWKHRCKLSKIYNKYRTGAKRWGIPYETKKMCIRDRAYTPQSRRRYLTVMYANSTHRNVELAFFVPGKEE